MIAENNNKIESENTVQRAFIQLEDEAGKVSGVYSGFIAKYKFKKLHYIFVSKIFR